MVNQGQQKHFALELQKHIITGGTITGTTGREFCSNTNFFPLEQFRDGFERDLLLEALEDLLLFSPEHNQINGLAQWIREIVFNIHELASPKELLTKKAARKISENMLNVKKMNVEIKNLSHGTITESVIQHWNIMLGVAATELERSTLFSEAMLSKGPGGSSYHSIFKGNLAEYLSKFSFPTGAFIRQFRSFSFEKGKKETTEKKYKPTPARVVTNLCYVLGHNGTSEISVIRAMEDSPAKVERQALKAATEKMLTAYLGINGKEDRFKRAYQIESDRIGYK